jgi:hypothetical protein
MTRLFCFGQLANHRMTRRSYILDPGRLAHALCKVSVARHGSQRLGSSLGPCLAETPEKRQHFTPIQQLDPGVSA